MAEDLGASAAQTGLSPSVEPASAVSPAGAASIPSADEFVRGALTARISMMLADLGHPPLVDRIFPKGWRNGNRTDLINLYELCRRTFEQREADNG